MNGCDHFKTAEDLVEQSGLDVFDKDRSRYARADLLAEAQVHATLALAAATIDAQLWLTPKHQWSAAIS